MREKVLESQSLFCFFSLFFFSPYSFSAAVLLCSALLLSFFCFLFSFCVAAAVVCSCFCRRFDAKWEIHRMQLHWAVNPGGFTSGTRQRRSVVLVLVNAVEWSALPKPHTLSCRVVSYRRSGKRMEWNGKDVRANDTQTG